MANQLHSGEDSLVISETSDTILKVGTVVHDKWVILELIDRGGMGEIYRAHQLNLKRDIALKVVSREWLESLDGDKEEIENAIQRFRREVEAMAQIRHPNIIQVFDHGSVLTTKDEREIPVEYIAMEYIPGSTMRSTMSEEGFYPDESAVRDWLAGNFLPVLDGVQAIHEHGIVHRDLKPENVLLDENTPKIADFGLARSCRLKPVTRSVDIRGTPPYMSPEQFFDFGRVDQRADIYSLGKILYETICGKMSSEATSYQKACLVNPETPFFQRMNQIIQNATVEERQNRISSIKDLKISLEELIETTSRKTYPPGQILVRKEKNWRKPFVIGAISLSLIVALSIAYQTISDHKPDQTVMFLPQVAPGVSAPTEKNVLKPSAPERQQISLSKKLEGENSTIFRLVPGGTVALAQNVQEQSGKILEVKSFYMSETPVTNQQYVNFLNQVLSNIKVEDGHVLRGENVWLRLGEVMRGYKPIVYREGQFHVKEAMHAACPVIRVTGYGAIAYAKHYEMRLPADFEWLYVLMKGTKTERTKDNIPATGVRELQLPIPTPVMFYEPNAYGIRGLNQNIGEWGLRPHNEDSKQKNNEYVLLGGLQDSSEINNTNPTIIRRAPRKSYADVGFRTVKKAIEADETTASLGAQPRPDTRSHD